MLQSHIIEIDGAFVGAAVRLDIGFRFVATDIRVEELDGTVWPSLPDLQRLAGGLYRTGRLSLPVQPVLRTWCQDRTARPIETTRRTMRAARI